MMHAAAQLLLVAILAAAGGAASDDAEDDSALFVRVREPPHLAYTYEIVPAQFGPPRTAYDRALRNVRLVAASLSESCTSLAEDVAGGVVIMPRGECSFIEKVAIAEAANARFALITEVNTSSTTTISMSRGEATTLINIPSAYISGSSGSRLHRFLMFSNDEVRVDVPINTTDISILFEKAPWEIW